MKFKRLSVSVDDQLYEKITNIANKTGDSTAETMRKLMRIGLTEKITEDNTDLIANVVRSQMEVVIKPHIERLAKLSSKTGHMASTATYLNVQAFQDLVPPERKKDVRHLYEKARKKAFKYMSTPTREQKPLD